MTARDFCYWLQGFFELSSKAHPALTLSNAQVEDIRRHLSMVFAHDIDPKAGGPAVQKTLDQIHWPPPPPPGTNVVVRC